MIESSAVPHILPEVSSTLDLQWLIEGIADDLYQKGYSINPLAMPAELTSALYEQLKSMSWAKFHDAAIGREQDKDVNSFVRTDKTCWIDGSSTAGQQWLNFTEQLRGYLNYSLQLGVFSFESHFAIYQQGDFYKRHLDAFKGKRNRVVSLVLYLNPDWSPDNGGELVLYKDELDHEGIKVQPMMGTLVCFMSEDFPHEVLPANQSRYSIAGWFRVNGSVGDSIDPPV